MNRKVRPGYGGMGLDSLVAKGKDFINTKMSSVPNATAVLRFRGKLGAAIAVISSLIVGFLVIPNNILYFIDNKYAIRLGTTTTTARSRPAHEYAYIHAGVALILMGCLAMVVSIVLSYFAAKSKQKMDGVEGQSVETGKSTRTVLACLVMMNVELFLAVIAGSMELLYQPLIADEQRLHRMECAIAVFNIVIYIMYLVTMVLTSTVLREKRDATPHELCPPDIVTVPPTARDYVSRTGISPYNTQSNFM